MRELLAELAHAQWSGWMLYLFSKLTVGADGSLTIPPGYAQALTVQMQAPYAALTEAEKDGDRAEADRVLALLFQHGCCIAHELKGD